MDVLNLLLNFLPSILDLFKYILGLEDDEFQEISRSWPAPIKTKMAQMRFEAKLLDKFPDQEVSRDQ